MILAGEFRVSSVFSRYVKPRTATRAPLIFRPDAASASSTMRAIRRGMKSFTSRAVGINSGFDWTAGDTRSHESLGMQWPPTPAPGMSIIRYGHVLTRSRTRYASTPSSSLIKATSFAKAIWTSQYSFSAVFTISADALHRAGGQGRLDRDERPSLQDRRDAGEGGLQRLVRWIVGRRINGSLHAHRDDVGTGNRGGLEARPETAVGHLLSDELRESGL